MWSGEARAVAASALRASVGNATATRCWSAATRAPLQGAVASTGARLACATGARHFSEAVPTPRPNDVGILAMECYVPTRYVTQSELEKADGVGAGKYTVGLGQEGMAFVDDREDINSICLTAVNRLLDNYGIDPRDVGRLEVGTESLVDKSKSAKTTLMQLFESRGNRDLEGATVMNACYGGTASFLNSTAWVESSAWDGRYAIFVAADIAVYEAGPARPTGGVGAVACLVGPNAPLVMLSRSRSTHASDAWDFYKPRLSSEYPSVDGQLSLECYINAVDDTYNKTVDRMAAHYGVTGPSGSPAQVKDLFEYMVFHSPYNKLVRQSFGRLLWNDFKRLRAAGAEIPDRLTPLLEFEALAPEESAGNRDLVKALVGISGDMYDDLVGPSTHMSRHIGNTYTASVFANLLSLIQAKRTTLPGRNVGVFSYGSGAIATMYGLRAVEQPDSDFTLARIAETVGLDDRLAARRAAPPSEFAEAMQVREKAYGQADYTPLGSVDNISAGAFYLDRVDDKHRRQYLVK